MKWLLIFVLCFISERDCEGFQTYYELLKRENDNIGFDTIALVLARKNSKGVLNKNLQQINGITLIGRTLIQIIAINLFDEIWVSTDSEEIAKEAKQFGAHIHRRPSKLALDGTSSISVVQDFISNFNHVQNIALFQCTSIFLKSEYIKRGFRRFRNADCVFSVTRSFALRWTYNRATSILMPLNFKLDQRPRRQDWAGELVENGMFYFAKRHLIEMGNFQNQRCAVVTISPRDSLEVDEFQDLCIARCMANQQSENTDRF